MRRSISKILYRSASSSSATSRGRDFFPTNSIDPSSEKSNVGTPKAEEEEAKSKPFMSDIFGVFSSTGPQSSEKMQPTNVVSSDPDVKIPTSRTEVLDFLRELLERAKHSLMAERGIKSQEEWEETVELTLTRLTMMREAPKRQNEKLQRIAEAMPATTPASTKHFVQQFVVDLQSNSKDCWAFDDRHEFVTESLDMYGWCIEYMDRLYENKLSRQGK